MADGRVPADSRRIGGLFQEGRCNLSIHYQKEKKKKKKRSTNSGGLRYEERGVGCGSMRATAQCEQSPAYPSSRRVQREVFGGKRSMKSLKVHLRCALGWAAQQVKETPAKCLKLLLPSSAWSAWRHDAAGGTAAMEEKERDGTPQKKCKRPRSNVSEFFRRSVPSFSQRLSFPPSTVFMYCRWPLCLLRHSLASFLPVSLPLPLVWTPLLPQRPFAHSHSIRSPHPSVPPTFYGSHPAPYIPLLAAHHTYSLLLGFSSLHHAFHAAQVPAAVVIPHTTSPSIRPFYYLPFSPINHRLYYISPPLRISRMRLPSSHPRTASHPIRPHPRLVPPRYLHPTHAQNMTHSAICAPPMSNILCVHPPLSESRFSRHTNPPLGHPRCN
ncbi:hypothetical protein C8J57DRAFT_1240111 [Mycena rebaudengoi]|nr:hypothetical protein C8J57DRAFT_1240111 [Mycena rebaudengoi]